MDFFGLHSNCDLFFAVRNVLQGYLSSYAGIDSATQKAYASINDLVAVKKVDSSGFEEQMDKTKKVLTNTKNWMDTFNSASQKNSAVTDNLTKIKAELTSLEGVSSLSYTATDASSLYAMKDFKKQVRAEHEQASAALKEFENEYDPANYTWDHWSNSTVGKEVSKYVNMVSDGFSEFLAKLHLDVAVVQAKNTKNLIEQLKSFYDNAGGKAGKSGKYGKTGYRAGVYVNREITELLKRDDKFGSFARKSQKFGKGICRSWEVGKYKSSRWAYGYISRHKYLGKTTGWLKKAADPTGTIKNIIMEKSKYDPKYAKLVKFAKSAKVTKVMKKAGWAGMAVDMGFSASGAYKDRDSLAYKSVGKSVIHAGVDQLKTAGPLEYSMAFAKLGPVGAGFGFGLGIANSALGAINPKLKDKIYNNVEKAADKGYDYAAKKIKNVGKAVSKSFSTLKKSVGFG